MALRSSMPPAEAYVEARLMEKKVLQALKQNKLKNFTASLSGVEFIKHKKALFSFLRAVCSDDTMYTHYNDS